MRQGLRHIALKTADIPATERLYIDVLGLEVAFPHRGMTFLKTAGGDDLLNFVETREAFGPRVGGLEHFGIRVSQEQSRTLEDRLSRAGVAIHDRREQAALYVQDPNGYTVGLYRD